MASTSQLNLYIQLILIVGLTVGLLLSKRKKLVQHGWLMLILTLLNLASIIVVMAPVAYQLLTRLTLSSFSLITILHASLGLIVLYLSIRLLTIWRFQKPGSTCYRMKDQMLKLYLFWVAEVILGIALYYQLYI
ncbi:hypothetical protein A3K78_03910 [Candidatus Bathyarchaeota archaeon RBG_13_52_12]|nr:MAG: hypothetical protein A3K78_03910 [Candidatus Bathyarchaeota archaeon RBG_13_52_12]